MSDSSNSSSCSCSSSSTSPLQTLNDICVTRKTPYRFYVRIHKRRGCDGDGDGGFSADLVVGSYTYSGKHVHSTKKAAKIEVAEDYLTYLSLSSSIHVSPKECEHAFLKTDMRPRDPWVFKSETPLSRELERNVIALKAMMTDLLERVYQIERKLQ